jgi:membrane protease YdiL (CAAX protease family)
MLASHVIAAPAGIDHALEQAEAPSLLSTWLLPVWAVVMIGFVGFRRWYRLPGFDRPSPLTGPVALVAFAVLWLAALIGAQAGLVALGAIEFGEAAPEVAEVRRSAVLMLGAYGMQMVLIVVLAMTWLRAGGSAQRDGHARAMLVGLVGIVVLWPFIQLAGIGASLLSERITGEPVADLAHDTLRMLSDAGWGPWSLTVAALAGVAAPLAEEVLFRGLLQEGLRRLGLSAWPAIVLASIGFVLVHVNVPVAMFAPLLVLSLGLGAIYERSGRLAAPIVAHMAFNLANLALLAARDGGG